jgi:hypothetical protein
LSSPSRSFFGVGERLRRFRSRRLILLLVLAAVVIGGGSSWYLWSEGSPSLPSREPREPEARPPRPSPRGVGVLRLSTSPAGATIELDGRPTGRLSPDELRVSADVDHRARLVLEGYEAVFLPFRLTRGEIREVHVELKEDAAAELE